MFAIYHFTGGKGREGGGLATGCAQVEHEGEVEGTGSDEGGTSKSG